MTRAFVSYSRKDTDFTRKLTDALIAQNMELWVDWKNIPPTVDWKLQIQKGVEEADTFLFLISPDSVKSGECAEEIAHAVKNGKRFIPLLVREINPEELPKEIKHINWIDFNKKGSFDEAFQQLLEAINTDYEWLQIHSNLQMKALDWERHSKDNSLLLRGMELESFEGQLVTNSAKKPEPTELQLEFVLESKKAKEAERKARERQQKTITIASAIVAVIMIILAGWAVQQRGVAKANEKEANSQRTEAEKQRNEAKKQENIANANAKKAEDSATLAQIGEVSALAVSKIDQDYNEALLFSVEAYRQAEETGFNRESARSALLRTLESHHGLKQILEGHNDWITALSYSPSGKLLASSSWDSVTILWNASDPANPTKISELKGDDVAFSPAKNNLLMATTTTDRQDNSMIQLWSYDENGKMDPLGNFSGQKIVDFSPDGKNIITTNYDNDGNQVIEIWDISSPSQPILLSTLNGQGAAINQSGGFLAVIDSDENYDSIVVLWDITDPKNPVKKITLKGDRAVFNPTNNIIAIANYQTTSVELWDIANVSSPRKLGALSGQADSVNGIVFSHDGSYLVLGSDEGNIYLWDTSDPENLPTRPFETLSGHTLSVYDLAFNPNGNILASGSNDGSVLLWDTENTNNPIQSSGVLSTTTVEDISTSGKFVVTSEYDNNDGTYSLAIWDDSDIANPKQIGKISKVPETYFIRINPTGNILVYSSYDQKSQKDYVTIWNISDPAKPAQVKTLELYSLKTMFGQNGQTLVLDHRGNTDADTSLSVWDISKPAQINQLGTLNGYQAIFSPDGRFIAANIQRADKSYDVQLWDISNWSEKKKVGEIKGFPKRVKTTAYNPTGTMLAVGSDDKTITLWDITNVANPVKISTLNGHSDWINTVVFSPDGSMLASGGDDFNIILWGIDNAKEITQIGTLKGHTSRVTSIAFSNDGLTLISKDGSGDSFLWDINPASWMEKACHMVGSNFSSETWKQLFPNKPYRETCTNSFLASTQPTPPVESAPDTSATILPVCTDTLGNSSCSLLTLEERDRFCIESVPYTLYAVPQGTTLTPIDQGFNCTDEGVRGGFQLYTCYSLTHPNMKFQANMCNTSCQVTQSNQCDAGLGLDASQSCCAPVSTDGCTQVTLEVGECAISQ